MIEQHPLIGHDWSLQVYVSLWTSVLLKSSFGFLQLAWCMLLYGPSRDFRKLQWMGTFIVKAFADCTFSPVPFTNLCPFSERMAKAEAFVRCRERGRWLLSRKKDYLNLSDTQHCGILAYSYRSTGNQVFQVSELKISQKVSRTSHKTASFKLGMQEVWESREINVWQHVVWSGSKST